MSASLAATRDHCRLMATTTRPVAVWVGRALIHVTPTDAERRLWGQLADEIDAYLTPADGTAGHDQPVLEGA